MSREGVCIHGALRRQCETCDLADQLEKMTKERYYKKDNGKFPQNNL